MPTVLVVALSAALAFSVGCCMLMCANMLFLGCVLAVFVRNAQQQHDATPAPPDEERVGAEAGAPIIGIEMDSVEEREDEVERLLEGPKVEDDSSG